MLTLDECIGFSDLNEDELAVIAEHEQVAPIVAVEIGYQLLQTPRGIYTLRGYIHDLLDAASVAGQRTRVKQLERVLDRFNAEHPTPRVLYSAGAVQRSGQSSSAAPDRGQRSRPRRA